MLPKVPKHGRIKPKRMQDVKHLHAVRALPCLVCGSDRSDMSRSAHHLKDGMVTGWGLRAGDQWTVPLCTQDHNGSNDCAHNNTQGSETAWFASKGIHDAPGIAKALYEATGDYEAMLNALRRN